VLLSGHITGTRTTSFEGFRFAVALLGGAVFRPAQNIIIFLVAVHGTKPSERREIIEAIGEDQAVWSLV
jgi:hypothetical protein